MSRPACVALALALAACATSRRAAAPDAAAARAEYGDLAEKNDEELFAVGSAARQARDPLRAALAFSRLADAFPSSGRARAALQGAGQAWSELERCDRALPYLERLSGGYRGDDADEAGFLAAECLYRAGRRAEARDALDRLAARHDLEPPQVARALTQRGVVELEDGQPEAAERSLELALASWQRAGSGERSPGYYPGKAHFYLGEVYRSRLIAVRLDPAADEPAVARQLEAMSQLLLSAQGHYLDAIRAGDPGWAVNACARVGELYDGFYHQLVDAPLPPRMEGELAVEYRRELRRSARVLVEKAIAAYQEALSVARHTGAESSLVPSAQESLDQMRRLLQDGEDEPGGG